MYCDLQSRGIKRKFGEDKDSEDSTHHLRSDGSVRVNPALSKLQNSCCNKTNLLHHKTITSQILHHHLNIQNCYVRQRQHLFNLSMCKLNRYRQSPDPSLSRSVLICNTLRTLEKEFEREGIKINLSPSGVSYIPSVLSTQSITQSITLDPPPSAPQSTNNQNHNTSTNSNTNSNTVTEPSSYIQVNGSNGENENDSTNGEYDKYLLDLDSSSGRVTPFHKPLSSNSSVYDRLNDASPDLSVNAINSLTQSTTSAFWSSDDASDRLTSLNWSSVLNFNSSNVTTSANKTLLYSTNGQNETTESISGDLTVTITTSSGNTITTNSRPSTSFTTLLPPSTSSSSTTSTNTNTTSSANSSTSSPNTITQNVLNSQHSNHMSHTNGNNSVSYSNATNDEIFGDIDLSLYDFDLLSPLSPPNVKLAPITAEELIRTISPTDSNSSGISSSSSTSTSLSSSSVLSSVLSTTSSSSPSSSPSSPSSSSSACLSTSSGYHGRYFKSSDKLFNDDRDQKAITSVMS